jgi:hypothetical protein
MLFSLFRLADNKTVSSNTSPQGSIYWIIPPREGKYQPIWGKKYEKGRRKRRKKLTKKEETGKKRRNKRVK